MVFPPTIDEQIVASEALSREAEAFQNVTAPDVVRHIVGHDTMQIHLAESKVDCVTQSFLHVTKALLVGSKAVSDVAILRDAAHYVVEIDEADYFTGSLLEDKQL